MGNKPTINRVHSEPNLRNVDQVITQRSTSLPMTNKWVKQLETIPEDHTEFFLRRTKISFEIVNNWIKSDRSDVTRNNLLAVKYSIYTIYKTFVMIEEHEKAEPYFEMYLHIENILQKYDKLDLELKTVKNRFTRCSTTSE